MKRIVILLHAAVLPFLDRYQPILMMDACKVHLSESLAQCCASRGIWLVIVPAKLTWLLQPCDTHVFQKYKIHLKAAYQRLRIASDAGEVDTVDLVAAICETIRLVMQGRRWSAAFEFDGFGSGQAGLSVYVLRQLAVEVAPAVGVARPSLDILQRCFPSGSQVPMGWLMRPMEPVAPAALVGPSVALALPAPVLNSAPQLALPGPVGGGLAALPVGRPLGVPRRPLALAAAGPLTRSQSRLVAALRGPAPPTARPPAVRPTGV